MAIKKRHVKAVIQFRRATEAEWYQYNPILRAGEPALSTDVMKVKVGDGTTDWVSLQYIDRNVSDSVIFVDTIEGITGQLYKLYVDLSKPTAYIWDNGFEELESSSIDDLKRRMTQAESDITDLQQAVIHSADKNYVHKQSSAADQWIIIHNLGKYPSITVVDSASTVVVGEIVLQTTEQAVISFNGAFSGKAYCN